MAKSSPFVRIDATTELHLLAEDDAGDLYQLVESNRDYLREWLPWIDYIQNVEDERAFISNTRTQYQNNQSFTYAIWYQQHIAGIAGYNQLDWVNRKVDIGYWLAGQYQGKGIITRSCHGLIEHAFEDLKLNKVEITCATMNTRSCAIPQRLGFTQEGIIRQAEWLYDHFVDHKLYGMPFSCVSESAWMADLVPLS